MQEHARGSPRQPDTSYDIPASHACCCAQAFGEPQDRGLYPQDAFHQLLLGKAQGGQESQYTPLVFCGTPTAKQCKRQQVLLLPSRKVQSAALGWRATHRSGAASNAAGWRAAPEQQCGGLLPARAPRPQHGGRGRHLLPVHREQWGPKQHDAVRTRASCRSSACVRSQLQRSWQVEDAPE